jgi:potassium-dependent mechanosensitive channel
MTRTGGDVRIRSRGAVFAAILVLATGLAWAPSAAQQPEGEEPGAAAAPSPVPIGEISRRARALETRLEQIGAVRPTHLLERVETQLAEAQKEATGASEHAESLLERRLNPSEVARQSARWRRLDARFERLQNQVGRQADVLDGLLAEIVDETATWQETLREAQRTRAPPAVQREAQRVLEQLAAARSQVGSDYGAALALRDRVRQARGALAPIFERLELEREEFAAALLERQDEPIWQSVRAVSELSRLGGEIAAELAANRAEIGRYARTGRDLLIFQGVLWLTLAWFLSRARARRDLRHPEIAAAPDPLRHPWAAAFLIAVLVTPLFQRELSRSLYFVISMLALLAWYRVLRGVLASALHGPLLGLAVLMLAEVIRSVLIGVSMVDRTLLLVDLSVGLVGIAWLRRPQRLQYIPWLNAEGFWLGVLDGWMRIAAPVLAVGLGAALLGYTSLADCIATLAIWGTVVGAAWIALIRVAEAVTEQIVEEGGMRHLRMVYRSQARFLYLVRLALRAFGLLVWAYVTLTSAGLWSPARSAIDAVLSFPIGPGSVAFSLGSLITFAVTLWLSWILSRFVAHALNEELFTRVRMAPGVPFALSTFTRYAILVMGFMIAMGSLGFSLDRVTLLLSAVGVGIGFGLQNVVNNFVSGMILLLERPIRVGDWVQLGDLFGVVSSIGIRASKLRTFDGADVVVPNADFISLQVTNWTLSDRKRRIILPVGVAYGTEPRQVIELLEQAARSHPGVLSDPAPVALFRRFGESSLDFELRAFTDGDWLAVTSDLAVATNEAFQGAGITIPFPQRDLHLRDVDELRDALDKPSA